MAPNPKKKRAVREVMLVRQASSRATPHGRSVGIPIVEVSPPSARTPTFRRDCCAHTGGKPRSQGLPLPAVAALADRYRTQRSSDRPPTGFNFRGG